MKTALTLVFLVCILTGCTVARHNELSRALTSSDISELKDRANGLFTVNLLPYDDKAEKAALRISLSKHTMNPKLVEWTLYNIKLAQSVNITVNGRTNSFNHLYCNEELCTYLIPKHIIQDVAEPQMSVMTVATRHSTMSYILGQTHATNVQQLFRSFLATYNPAEFH